MVNGSTRLTVVVWLRINRANQAEFEQFETKAAQIMRTHGGTIERRIGFRAGSAPPASTSPAGASGRSLELERAQIALPDEIHIVTFPDPASFDRYRADPDLKALVDLRSRVIFATTVWPGFDLPPFLP